MPLSQAYSPTYIIWIQIYPSPGLEPHRVMASVVMDTTAADAIAASIEALQGVVKVTRQNMNGCWATEYQVAVNWLPSEISTALNYEFQQMGIPAEKIHIEVVA